MHRICDIIFSKGQLFGCPLFEPWLLRLVRMSFVAAVIDRFLTVSFLFISFNKGALVILFLGP